MIEQIKYINHLNEVIEFGKNGIFINYNTLRDYSWDITSANNKIASFKKGIVSKTIPVIIKCHSEEEGIEIRNRLFEVFEKDVLAKKNGRIVIGEYYLKCYITGSKKTKYLINDGYMHLSLTMKSDYPAWIKESFTIFRPKSALNTSETAEGREILIGNATNSILTGYGVYGKSEQKSYTGKNLLQNTATSQTINGISFVVNEDGSITVNGTASATAKFEMGYITLPNGAYLVNGGYDENKALMLQMFFKDGTSKYYRADEGGYEILIDDTVNRVRVYLQIYSDITVSNLVFKPMIRKATITDETYEQYVGGEASPNPSYPQDIVSVAEDGDLVVKSNNKNLCEGYFDSGVTVSPYLNVLYAEADFKPNTTYYISFNSTGERALYLNENLFVGRYVNITVGRNIVKVKTLENISKNKGYNETYGWILLKNQNATNIASVFSNVMITYEEDSDYIEHQSTQATIPLTDSLRGIKVTEGGNYTDETGQQWVCDTLEKYADGSGKLVQRIYHKVFDGTEAFVLQSTKVGNRYYWYGDYSKGNINQDSIVGAMCNKLIEVSPAYSYNNKVDCFSVNTPNASGKNSMIFRLASLTNITDVATLQAQLKSWYDAGEPLEFICERAEYLETPLTAEQIAEIEKLQTFEGVTYITNEDDAYQTAIYSIKQYLDFPYGYEYDFTADFDSDELLNTSFVPVDFRMVVHGAVTNPSVFISDHEYSVDVTIEEGDYLTIDSQTKTIVLSKQDGTQVNCFNNRNRDSYVFEKIPSGRNQISSSGDLNIDITLLDERSEPRWI